MKIAVVGGGIFGSISAIKLRGRFPNSKIELFERRPGLLWEASGTNQYRLHRGYHYPRSFDTAIQSKSGTSSFLMEYGDCLQNRMIDHYYCISREDSLVDRGSYLSFLKLTNLSYHVSKLKVINQDEVSLIVNVDESLIDIANLKLKLIRQLIESKVTVHVSTEFKKEDVSEYDMVINCAYSNLNSILDESDQIDYQFELCEKPIIRLDSDYKNLSVVIMDGPFMCIDPLDKYYHVMGHVKHAIHNTNIGRFPEIPNEYLNLVNLGCVKSDSISHLTQFQGFLEHGRKYFLDFNPLHVRSMFTIRTVLPGRDLDDSRPSYITRHSDKIYSVFSGKIGTAVDIANELINMV